MRERKMMEIKQPCRQIVSLNRRRGTDRLAETRNVPTVTPRSACERPRWVLSAVILPSGENLEVGFFQPVPQQGKAK